MAKTLLKTRCSTNISTTPYTQNQENTYYDPALRAAGKSPTAVEYTNLPAGSTCTAFDLAAGTQLDQYCVTTQSNQAVKRTITYSSQGTYQQNDLADASCTGTCNLAAPDITATNTSATGLKDGTITVTAYTTRPPVDAYIPQLGLPSSGGLLYTTGYTKTYQWTWTNVKPGTYSAQLQDNGNCQLTTDSVTVANGAGAGTGAAGAGIVWFKYEYVDPGPQQWDYYSPKSNGGIRGLAWEKSIKNYYSTGVIPLTYPYYNLFASSYNKGTIVGYVRENETVMRYYRAAKDLVSVNGNFLDLPNETGIANGSWERIPDGIHDNVVQQEIGYFDPTPVPPVFDGFHLYNTYAKDQVVRYGYVDFYAAAKDLDGQNYPSGFPHPVYRQNSPEWTYLPNYSPFFYAAAETDIIDQYAYGNQVRRVRFHLDIPNYPDVPSTAKYLITPDTDFVLFDDNTPTVETQLGELKVIDIIKNDVDVAGAENGSAGVMAQSPSMPIRYHLRNGVRDGYVQDNNTGIYEDLSPGEYMVDIYDSFQPNNRYISASFTIYDQYQSRWRLSYDDLKGVVLETLIFERGYTGQVTNVCGQGQPALLTWDSGSDPSGALPESAGATLQFNLLTQVAQQFVETALGDDRLYRIDHYRDDVLQFRGYIDQQSYQEAMLGPGQTVSLLASCGLGKLSNTKFVNHERERQTAHTNQLSIILKILSFCDVNLPLYVGVNLRDQLMAADADPLDAAYVHRNAYFKKDGKVIADADYPDCRTVLNAILRLYNAQIFQAEGTWRIISFSEVFSDFAVRVWSPAGTLLSGIDTSSAPLRILEPGFATGERELFWVDVAQKRTSVAAVQLVKALVDLQLETSLFANGDLVDWNLDVPTYWSKQGSLGLTRTKGEKAGESALKFADYDHNYSADKYLLSPPVTHFNGQQEDYMRLKVRAIVDPTTNNPTAATVNMYFQLVVDGQPYADPIEVPMTSKDKWKDYEFDLPFGFVGSSVRVRILEPINTSGSINSTVRINSVYLAIAPGLVDWEDQKQDYVYIENQVFTGIQAPDLDLVHADLPMLPDATGLRTLPAKAMDILAWRHAVSLADYSATTSWKRPAGVQGFPLLDNAAQDRIAMRNVVATQVSGTVFGPGIRYLRQGIMLDMPEDVDGRFVVISCAKDERRGAAQITVRKLADGDFGGVDEGVPDQVRIGFQLNRMGFRIGFSDDNEGYRIGYL